MAYDLITKYTAKNYTPKNQVQAVFGEPPTKTSATVHHWGAMESGYRPARFYEICNYLASANARMVSAHYVVERGKVACLISPEHASWANGDAKGNAQSITIECNPLCSEEDKATLAELVADLRAAYGDLLLVPHSYWTPTECPGRYDVYEIDRMALAIERGTAQPAAGPVTPIKEKDWLDMVSKNELEDILENVARRVVRDEIRRVVGDVVDVPTNYGTKESRANNPTWTVSNALTKIWNRVEDMPERILTHPVQLRGSTEGTTNLETKIAWQAHEFHRSHDAAAAIEAQLAEHADQHGGKYSGAEG